MDDISNLMGRLNAKVAYHQFNEPVTQGQTQSPRLAAGIQGDQPETDAEPEEEVVQAVAPVVAESERELFIIEPRTDGKMIEVAQKPMAPRPSRAKTAASLVLRRYGPPVPETPRTLAEIFALLESKAR